MENSELIWGTRVVFFGEAHHGKSSLMGFMFAKSQNINMDRHEAELREDLGSNFKLDYLYSSLVNPIVADVVDSDDKYRTKKYHLRNFLINDEYPIVITLIDTPGQLGGRYKRARPNQEYGISKGNIGVFCVSIRDIQDDNFDGRVFNRIKPWRAFHKNRKLIIALTQFDRVSYSNEAYYHAVQKIHKYLSPSEIADIIPVAIDFRERVGINVFELNENTMWYNCKTLVESIKQQHFNIENNNHDGLCPSDLVFSIDKEIPHPRSNAGKVWRIFIENGSLRTGAKVSLSSVKRENGIDIEIPLTATAIIKELKMDLKIEDEDQNDADFAYKGTSLSINLKDCYIDEKKCHKREIETTEQTIGLASNVEFEIHRDFFITFDNKDDILILRSCKQQIEILIFGRATPATITKIPEDLSGVFIQTLANKCITIPKRSDLRELSIFKNVVIRIPISHNEFEYLPAKLVVNLEGK